MFWLDVLVILFFLFSFVIYMVNVLYILSFLLWCFFMFLELVICGIGYYYVGLDFIDRYNIEVLFIKGDIFVLCKYIYILVKVF